MEKLPIAPLLLPVPTAATLFFSACNKTMPVPAPAVTAPAGPTYTILRQGTVMAQGGVSSGGMLAVGKGSDGSEYVQFKTDFHSGFRTGSLGIYLARVTCLKTSAPPPPAACRAWAPSRNRGRSS